jgi:4-alpha-glucanotransferase
VTPPARISLALVLHNHQPVGNFGWVIEEVFARPTSRWSRRSSATRASASGCTTPGPLLEWIGAERPEFIERLRALVERGQVEILGGGPLRADPRRAARARPGRPADCACATRSSGASGTAPGGAWLAERVWEPSLRRRPGRGRLPLHRPRRQPPARRLVPEDEMWGTYTTDDQGRLLTVFGTEKGLRYRIPFRPVAELIDYLRDHATADGRLLGTMGDDGEKFGAWPGTYEHCWGEGPAGSTSASRRSRRTPTG